MRVLLLSDAHSIHTIKWAKGLSENNVEVGIFSLHMNKDDNPYKGYSNITVFYHIDDRRKGKESRVSSNFSYVKVVPCLKQVVKKFKPDIVHAHYISGYGLLGTLLDFHPYIISVWGSDIFDYPKASFIHKMLIKYYLHKADKILSTSNVMAIETKKYTNKDVEVTPFGIDLEKFKPFKVDSLFSKDDIVIGTIKTLEEKYGIEYLIRAFAIVKQRHQELPLKLLIVGDGSLRNKLEELSIHLGIAKDTVFTGKIKHELVPKYANMLSVSVSVSVSNSESFGVAIIEASACGIPVVVSNVGGLPEVVEDKVTGYVVPARNPEATADAIEKLILSDELKIGMGKAGRERVKKLYDWNKNVDQMVSIYKEMVSE